VNTLSNAALTTSIPTTTSQGRLSRPEAIPRWRNPTQLERPSYLLSFPFSLSTEVANNPWMEDLPGDRRYPNFKGACVLFQGIRTRWNYFPSLVASPLCATWHT